MRHARLGVRRDETLEDSVQQLLALEPKHLEGGCGSNLATSPVLTWALGTGVVLTGVWRDSGPGRGACLAALPMVA